MSGCGCDERVIVFYTLNSRYEIDHEQRTWTRTHTNGVATLNSESGSMWGHGQLIIGKPVVIIGPPFDPSMGMRVLTTSNLVAIKEKVQ